MAQGLAPKTGSWPAFRTKSGTAACDPYHTSYFVSPRYLRVGCRCRRRPGGAVPKRDGDTVALCRRHHCDPDGSTFSPVSCWPPRSPHALRLRSRDLRPGALALLLWSVVSPGVLGRGLVIWHQ